MHMHINICSLFWKIMHIWSHGNTKLFYSTRYKVRRHSNSMDDQPEAIIIHFDVSLTMTSSVTPSVTFNMIIILFVIPLSRINSEKNTSQRSDVNYKKLTLLYIDASHQVCPLIYCLKRHVMWVLCNM